MTPRAQKPGEKRVRLEPQDPFDLIRLLARSQSDPRKAVAELVQNSLDAGAKRVEITWFNEQGQRALRIQDDGAGIFPELAREEALERIARTIGHSHKHGLSPADRREQMVLGRYGIGLIGFWSVGEVMLVRSRVGGGRAFVLRLVEDRATAEVAPSRSRRVDEEDTFTEITILGVHAASAPKIRPPRLQAYLASELRGQLLERRATITIHDRVARGRARKLFTVEPRPYLGAPLCEWTTLTVEGFENARVELYLVAGDDGRRGAVTLACGGTTVLDDLALIDGDDAPRAPWSSGRLEGVIDFPDFSVAPSTRRGLVHNEPLDAFLAALPRLEAELEARLANEEARRASQEHENLAKDIRRAFRAVAVRLPEYELFEVQVRGSSGRAARAGDPVVAALNGSEPGAGEPEDSEQGERSNAAAPVGDAADPARGAELAPRSELAESAAGTQEPHGSSDARDRAADVEDDDLTGGDRGPMLFPPGPLHAVEVEPRHLRLPWSATRGVRARALDADGRLCAGAVAWTWELLGPGEVESEGARARYTAPVEPFAISGVNDARLGADSGAHPGSRLRVRAEEHTDGRSLQATAEIDIAFQTPATPDRTSGIPEPTAVLAPAERWRSRMRGDRWEFNAGHPDYLTASGSEAGRLRYLVQLFAKEVVLRNFGSPADAEVLERMVEILVCLDAERRRST